MPLSELLNHLAAFAPTDLPVISLYLNTQSDQHGRDSFGPFVRKELDAPARRKDVQRGGGGRKPISQAEAE